MKGALTISSGMRVLLFSCFLVINSEASVISCVKNILKIDHIFPNDKVRAASLLIRTASRSKDIAADESLTDVFSRWVDAVRLKRFENKAYPLDLNNLVQLNAKSAQLGGSYDVNHLGLQRRTEELQNRKGFAKANTSNIRNQEQLDIHFESMVKKLNELVDDAKGAPVQITEFLAVLDASIGRPDMRLDAVLKEYGIDRINFISPEKWFGLKGQSTEATILKTYPSGASSIQLEVLGVIPKTKEEMALWVSDFITDLHEAVRIQLSHTDNENIKHLGVKEADRLLGIQKSKLTKLDERVYTATLELRNYLNTKAKLDPEFNALGLPESALSGTGWYRFKLASKTMADVVLGDISDAASWAIGKLRTSNPIEENKASLAWFSKEGIALERLKEQKQRESWKLYQIFRKHWETKGRWMWRATAAVALTVLFVNRENREEVQQKMTDRGVTPTTLTDTMRKDSNPLLEREKEKLNRLKAERDKAQLENDIEKVTDLEDKIDTVLAGLDAITGAK